MGHIVIIKKLYKISLNKTRDKRWDKNEKILKAACILYWADFDKITKKEKYWRYDLTDRHSCLPYEVLFKIENDSLNMCETCWKTSRQYWDYGGRHTHHCLKHYLILILKKHIRILILKLKRYLWKIILKQTLMTHQ